MTNVMILNSQDREGGYMDKVRHLKEQIRYYHNEAEQKHNIVDELLFELGNEDIVEAEMLMEELNRKVTNGR